MWAVLRRRIPELDQHLPELLMYHASWGVPASLIMGMAWSSGGWWSIPAATLVIAWMALTVRAGLAVGSGKSLRLIAYFRLPNPYGCKS